MAPPDALPPATSQTAARLINFDKTVVSISNTKLGHEKLTWGLKRKSGTGFCLDPTCRFVGTNYHVADFVRPEKIKGEKVLRRYLATGPDDEGATLNYGQWIAPTKYTLVRDLAVFELRRPLYRHRGVAFSDAELKRGQAVDIYICPDTGVKSSDKAVRFHGFYEGVMVTGLLAFQYSSSDSKKIMPGASGGIVVDSSTQQIVGILNGMAKNGEMNAVAVPVSSLADFVSKIEPVLAATLFSSGKNAISPMRADLYPKLVSPIALHTLERRAEEPEAVRILRNRAQILVDSMRNFIAVETFEWGTRDKLPAVVSAYEVQLVDGRQSFRLHPDGTKHFSDVPFPNLDQTFVSGGEWSELPETVSKELHLKINEAADAIIETKRIKVFQYHADVEDQVCTWDTIDDFGFFEKKKKANVACYGEVWTDDNFNILRISQHLELTGKWKNYTSVVTYGWLSRAGETSRLIPLTMSAKVEYGKTMHWCRGQFINYRVFSSDVKITSN